MQVINYSKVRQNLSATMDKTIDDSDSILITRQNGRNTVLMSEDEYNSLMETFYLMRNPKMHNRILESINEDRDGKTVVRDLIEE